MSVAQAIGEPSTAPAGGSHLTCPIDDWTFDASVTEGRCPVCGWAPEGGSPVLAPAWVRFVRWVDWDVVFLAGLLIVAVLLGLWVSQAVHLTWADLNPAR